MDPADLKDLILNTKEPAILKNLKIPWSCFDKSFKDWCIEFDKSSKNGLEFDAAKRTCGDKPQWENDRSKVRMSALDFLVRSSENDDSFFQNNWLYFGYKKLKDLPESCRQTVDFSYFGFPEIEEGISFWLGSSGAHTPCHYDTYGCNVIVQVYGRKLWLLFPPEAMLEPTRIPYEESSVYSSQTLYSPFNMSQFKDIADKCYMCVLDPGDVLIVPNKWWHYVENKTTAFSINSWIPLNIDSSAYITECIVKLIIKKFTQDQNGVPDDSLLHPIEISQFPTEKVLLNVLKYFSDKKLEIDQLPEKRLKIIEYDYCYLTESQLTILEDKFSNNIHKVKKITEEDFYNLMKTHSKRFERQDCSKDGEVLDAVNEILINSICNPLVIEMVKNLFLNKYKDYLENI